MSNWQAAVNYIKAMSQSVVISSRKILFNVVLLEDMLGIN